LGLGGRTCLASEKGKKRGRGSVKKKEDHREDRARMTGGKVGETAHPIITKKKDNLASFSRTHPLLFRKGKKGRPSPNF